MVRRRLLDHSLALPSSSPLCELRFSAFNALSRETTHVRHCSPDVQTASICQPLFSITSKHPIPQPLSFVTLANACRCFPKRREIHPRPGPVANILFRIKSFAHPHPINPSESHLLQNRGAMGLHLFFTQKNRAATSKCYPWAFPFSGTHIGNAPPEFKE